MNDMPKDCRKKVQNSPTDANNGPRSLMPKIFFLHGLDSSGQGTKGRFFEKHFPHIRRPDFSGTLENRLRRLEELCGNEQNLILIGSSFGGLMAASYAVARPGQVDRLILLAPALNFAEYRPPARKVSIPCLLIIGRNDTVTPPDVVLPMAEATFHNLEVLTPDDDHLLHKTFMNLEWDNILSF